MRFTDKAMLLGVFIAGAITIGMLYQGERIVNRTVANMHVRQIEVTDGEPDMEPLTVADRGR